jgi:hypothetical protein
MGFEKALSYLKAGHKLTKGSWGEEGKTYLFLIEADKYRLSLGEIENISFKEGEEPAQVAFIMLCIDGAVLVPYAPILSDILSSDWKIVE